MRTFSKTFACVLTCGIACRAGAVRAETLSISNPLPDRAMVQFIAASGKTVHKGEALVVLDATALLEKRRVTDAALQAAEAEFKIHQEKIALLEADNAAALAAAASEVNQAERTLKRYVEGDSPTNDLIFKLSVIDAQADLDRHQERFAARDKLLANGAIPKFQYNTEEAELTKAKYALEIAQLKLDVFQKYEKPQMTEQFTNQLAQKKKAQTTLQAQCLKSANEAQAALQASKEKLKALTEERERLGRLLEKTVVYACADGHFFGGDPEQPDLRVEAGVTVNATGILGILKKP